MKTMRSPEINEIAAALAKAQGQMRNATLNRTNPHFKSRYADLASVFDAIRKPLADNGLAITQLINNSTLTTMLMHTSGQWLSSERALPETGRPQELGSALTYFRRYMLSSLIGIGADDDDDANGAEKSLSSDNFGENITPEQVAELNDLIVANGRSVDKFCDYKRIASLAEIRVGQFEAFKREIVGAGKK
jgi:ERF superfamily